MIVNIVCTVALPLDKFKQTFVKIQELRGIRMVTRFPIDTTIMANNSLLLMFITFLLVTLRLNKINKIS